MPRVDANYSDFYKINNELYNPWFVLQFRVQGKFCEKLSFGENNPYLTGSDMFDKRWGEK